MKHTSDKIRTEDSFCVLKVVLVMMNLTFSLYTKKPQFSMMQLMPILIAFLKHLRTQRLPTWAKNA